MNKQLIKNILNQYKNDWITIDDAYKSLLELIEDFALKRILLEKVIEKVIKEYQ